MSDASPHRWTSYAIALFAIAGWTVLVKAFLPNIELLNLAMTYLLANVLIAVRWGQGPAMASALLSVACFDFFFVPPYFTLSVANAKYWVSFLIMLIVTLLASRLTLQSRRNAQLAYEAEKKAKLEKLINLLLSSVSHDLRTPLTSIYGSTTALINPEARLSSEDRLALLEGIQEEAARLNRLIENILQITKIESGDVHLRKELHSLEEIVGNALGHLEVRLQGRHIETNIPPDLPLVPLDGLLIEQVFLNLLENALRHTPEQSAITLQAFLREAEVEVEILDRGPGIPLEERERIFEKFYRMEKGDTWGSGLGLAICRGILEIHQGTIGVKPREGGGSLFYFSLPLAAAKP